MKLVFHLHASFLSSCSAFVLRAVEGLQEGLKLKSSFPLACEQAVAYPDVLSHDVRIHTHRAGSGRYFLCPTLGFFSISNTCWVCPCALRYRRIGVIWLSMQRPVFQYLASLHPRLYWIWASFWDPTSECKLCCMFQWQVSGLVIYQVSKGSSWSSCTFMCTVDLIYRFQVQSLTLHLRHSYSAIRSKCTNRP